MNSFAEEMRRCARQALPEEAFLRRDRMGALYVTDAPEWWTEGEITRSLERAGFMPRFGNDLAELWPAPVWLMRLEDEYPEPPDFFSATLAGFHASRGIDDHSVRLFALGVRLLDGDRDDGRFERRLRQRAAVCLRSNRMTDEYTLGGGLYACALLRYMLKEEKT